MTCNMKAWRSREKYVILLNMATLSIDMPSFVCVILHIALWLSFSSLSIVASSSTAEGGVELKEKHGFVDSDAPSEIKTSPENEQELTKVELA